MSAGRYLNPFRGPQPYRAEDHERFFCREDVTRRLVNSILAHPCVSLFGPSGAGKSSLMQAAVIPQLQRHYGFRIVCVDAWRPRESPLLQLARSMFEDLDVGDMPCNREPGELIDEALLLAEQHSERPILIFLDQLEQPLLPGTDPDHVRDLFSALETISRAPIRGLQLVLSLREDYLGRLREQARSTRVPLDPGFRLGPLSVKEMTEIAIRLAAMGDPEQKWSTSSVYRLMLQMRTPGQSQDRDAEVQAVFAQLVCRVLWNTRAISGGRKVHEPTAKDILQGYLETTLKELRSSEQAARELLEEHLVSPSGSRTLLTEAEAHDRLPPCEADTVLNHLQAAAVLRSEYHEGGRYFELGHDWLASKVLELKRERETREAEARRNQQERTRRLRQRFAMVLGGGILLVVSILLYMTWMAQRDAANQALMTGAREAMERGQPAVAMKLLAEVDDPADVPRWEALALEALDSNFLKVTLQAPGGQAVNAASFDPEGDRVATASDDGMVRIWNANGHEPPKELEKHSAPVTAVEFSRDGRFLVTASRDGSARVWDTEKEEPARVFPHPEPVRSATFSPDGARIVTVAQDGIARLWSIDDTSRPLASLNDPSEVTFNFAAFSPDGQRLVTSAWNRTAWVWRAREGTFEKEHVLRGHDGPVTSAAFSHDGRRLMTTSMDGTAWLWRTEGPGHPFEPDKRLVAHDAPVTSGAFSPDKQYIVTASLDGIVRVWRWDGAGPPFLLQGHTGPVTSAVYSLNSRRRRLVTASQDGTARVWSADATQQPLYSRVMEHPEPVSSAAVDASGTHAVTAAQDGRARVWELKGWRPPIVLGKERGQALTSAAFSPDGQRIVTSSWDKKAVVWRHGEEGWRKDRVLEHQDPVLFAAFSPDGRSLATATMDGMAWVWSLEDASALPTPLGGHRGPVNSVAFSPDSQFIATASRDTTVRLRKTDDGSGTPGAPIVLPKGHSGPVNSVAFSPDGQNVISASQDGTARVWAWRTDPEEPRVLQHDGPVLSASFSPDGQRIATSSWDGTVQVRQADGKGVPRVLKGHEGPVRSAVFTPDGRVVTASWDGTTRVWHLPRTGTPSVSTLHQQLRERNRDCLDTRMRHLYLGEDDKAAQAGQEACERQQRQLAAQAAARRNDSLAAGSPSRM
ncbi:hypothetical protein ACLESO_29810 [Pyxidicoccus sp. 3LG]